MQGNVLGQNGGYNGLKIFVQQNEPNKKDGIWIKTTEKYNYKAVQIVNDFEFINSKYTQLAETPYEFYSGSAVGIGTDIYLLGGLGNEKYNYKYNILCFLQTVKVRHRTLLFFGLCPKKSSSCVMRGSGPFALFVIQG